MKLDRRQLLVAGGAGVGLVIGFALWPRAEPAPLAAGKGEQVLGPYLKIGTDGRVTVAIPQAEVGQGIWTGLAQVAAASLGAAWEQVAVVPAPLSPLYANALLGTRATAGSTSIRAFEQALHGAGETARDLLVRAAADRWDVTPPDCRVSGGRVHMAGRSLAFADVAEAAAALKPYDTPVSLAPEGPSLLGAPLPRVDAPAKAEGSLRFAGDVRLPGMVHAAARLAPPGGRHVGHRTPAGVRIVATDGWIAALGDTGWAAMQALKAAEPQWTAVTPGDGKAIRDALQAALDSDTPDWVSEVGDFDGRVGDGKALAATYHVDPAPHLSLEPLTATARWSGGRLELWAPVQAYDRAHALAVAAAGIDAADVSLFPTPVGDGGGRALEADAIPIAVDLAKRLGKPVQVTIPHHAARNAAAMRPPLLARMAALPGPAGGLSAWNARMVSAPGLGATLGRLREGAIDEEFGAALPPYAIPNLRAAFTTVDLPGRYGYLRGGFEGLAGFATESFVDEMALFMKTDPFALRMTMLSGAPRLARCLKVAAAAGGWDGGARGSRLGLACASGFGSHIALLAEAGIGADQQVDVTRLVAVVDCGRAINSALVRQQVEGGLLHALSLATAAPPELTGGMPVARSLRQERLHGACQVPEIKVEILVSKATPGGVSGLAHMVLAPSLANAIHAGTGRRLRRLPFDPMSE
jgi:isoquinoline 1-oxidoreductase beta subunit